MFVERKGKAVQICSTGEKGKENNLSGNDPQFLERKERLYSIELAWILDSMISRNQKQLC